MAENLIRVNGNISLKGIRNPESIGKDADSESQLVRSGRDFRGHLEKLPILQFRKIIPTQKWLGQG